MSVQMFQLPKQPDLILALIREEIKSVKLFTTFEQIGLGDCYYQPHLAGIILSLMGWEDPTDEVFEKFMNAVDRQVLKVEPNRGSLSNAAMNIFFEMGSPESKAVD